MTDCICLLCTNTQKGESAIRDSMKKGNSDITEILMKYGANTTKNIAIEQTELSQAIMKNELSLMEQLLDEGADIEQSSGQDVTPLIIACHYGFLEGVKLLIERGANIRASSAEGLTCLLVAAKKRHQKVLSYLLEQDSCPINTTEESGNAALHYIVPLDDPKITSCAINKGAEINAQNQNGEYPVFLAAKHNCIDSLKVLLEAGADPNVKTKSGKYALHEAVHEGRIEAVLILLSHGAERQEFKKRGQSPVDLALSIAVSRQVKSTQPIISSQPIVIQERHEDSTNVLETLDHVTSLVSNTTGLVKAFIGG
eukprot:g6638.t1